MLAGSARSIGGFSVLVVPWPARTAIGSRTASDAATTRGASPLLFAKVSDGIEHHHPGGRAPALLLLRRVDAMRPDVDGQAMNLPLHREVLELAEVLGVVLLEDGDRAAPARHVDSPEPRIELDDVRALRERQVRDRRLGIQVEDRQDEVALARQEGSVMCDRSEEHTSELQSLTNLVCRLLL